MPATVALNGTTATLTPAAALTTNTSYTATLAASITDLAGNPLGYAGDLEFHDRGASADGLVAAYAFDEAAGVTASDASGNGQPEPSAARRGLRRAATAAR